VVVVDEADVEEEVAEDDALAVTARLMAMGMPSSAWRSARGGSRMICRPFETASIR